MEEENEEPGVEFEGCPVCEREAEENGIEYTHDATYKDGVWVCDGCGKVC